MNTDVAATQTVTKFTVPFTKRILTTALQVREVINSYICVFKVLKIFKFCELYIILSSLW